MKKIFISIIVMTSIGLKAQDTLTIEQKINVAFDSYNVVYSLNSKQHPLSKKDSLTRVRNINHLNYMYSKKWFYDALNNEQKLQIGNIIK